MDHKAVDTSKIEEFIQATTLLMVITAISIFSTESPYILVLLCGILMILFAMRSLEDDAGDVLSQQNRKILPVMQLFVSVLIVLFSGRMISYLIFYEWRNRNKMISIAAPPLFYLICQTVDKEQQMPVIIFRGLILLAAGLGIFFLEKMILGYIAAKAQIVRALNVTAVNEMYEKKLNQELMMKNYLADRNARLEERENISRNIHNSVGHSITAAIMTLDAADLLFDTQPKRAREKMNMANERVRTSLESIRHAVRVLDSESEFVSMKDLLEEIEAVTDRFVLDTMLDIQTDFSNVDMMLNIPHEHAEFLTGAVQELLTNGVRHGKADKFIVNVTADSGHVRLTVSDNGQSDFSPQNAQGKIQKGFGLKKMISYVEKCGGNVVFENVNGFRSALTLPIVEGRA